MIVPMAVRDVNPPKPVEVLDGDTRHAGLLHAWRQLDTTWQGYVTYIVGEEEQVGWIDQQQLGIVGLWRPVLDPGSNSIRRPA